MTANTSETPTIETPAIGHNQPPSDVDLICAGLAERNTDVLARKNQLLEGAGRMPETVNDEETSTKVADFVKQLNAARKAVDDARKREKQPYLDGGKAVDGFFKDATQALDDAKAKASALLNDFMRRKAEEERRRRDEEARKAREEAERQRQEAQKAADDEAAKQRAQEAAQRAEQAEQQAGADTASVAKARSAHGTTASLRRQWTFDDLDPAQIDLEALRPHLSQDALAKALRAFIKAGGREIKGARIYEDASAVVR